MTTTPESKDTSYYGTKDTPSDDQLEKQNHLFNVYWARYKGFPKMFDIYKKMAAQTPKPKGELNIFHLRGEIPELLPGQQLRLTTEYNHNNFNEKMSHYMDVYHKRRRGKRMAYPFIKHVVGELGYDLQKPNE